MSIKAENKGLKCTAFPASYIYEKRKELFEARKSAVETEIQELQKTLSLLKFKCWYYETAMKDGNEDAINTAAFKILVHCQASSKYYLVNNSQNIFYLKTY